MDNTMCWVDTYQPDPDAAAAFYGDLLGWSFDGADDYCVARLGGHAVAGIGRTPAPPALWCTYVRVGHLEAALATIARAGGSILIEADGFAIVADPTGVAFGVTDRLAAEVAGEPGTWQMSALHSPDLEAAAAFYGAAFGWALDGMFFKLDGRVVAVATPAGQVPPHWAVNFRVVDVDATADQAAALGGAVLMAPMDTPGFRNAVVADPQGGVIAISAPS
jgi:predicted enzyme related to lactoylglutathione lyase